MALTKKDLETLPNEGKKKQILANGANTGLRAKRLANRVSFEVTKRVSGGRNTTSTVGYYPGISLNEALNLAHAIRVDAERDLRHLSY